MTTGDILFKRHVVHAGKAFRPGDTGFNVERADELVESGVASWLPAPAVVPAQDDLETLTVTELRERARGEDIAGASRMRKAELVAALRAARNY